MTVEAFAPAKINLTLHVTGQRANGYHLLESLVVFAGVGDRIVVTEAAEATLTVTGPMAKGVPIDTSNLVLQSADLLGVTAKITLEKHLPTAAGVGGGSSDAAATLRALHDLTGQSLPVDMGLSLGADVPVCLEARAALMAGIGEQVTPVPSLPALPAVLVNPRVGVSTQDVFRALTTKSNPPMETLPTMQDVQGVCDWLARQRNDLEGPARQAQPVIDDVLEALDAALLARMSGSGATCFGIYPDTMVASHAAEVIRKNHPEWWVVSTILNSSQGLR